MIRTQPAAASVIVLLIGVSSAPAGVVFDATSYAPAQTFGETLPALHMALTSDGSSLWTASGGAANGKVAQYSTSGTLLNTYSTTLDFRSLLQFGDAIYAHAYAFPADPLLRKMTGPGVFDGSGITLVGGTVGTQADVAYDGTNFIAHNGASVDRWTTAGTFVGTTTLAGYAGNGETGPDASVSIAAAAGLWFTYDTNNATLSAWSPTTGVRLDTTNLTSGPTGDASAFGLSYADGRIWLNDNVGSATSNWLGYAVSLPEPNVSMLALSAGWMLGRRRRAVEKGGVG